MEEHASNPRIWEKELVQGQPELFQRNCLKNKTGGGGRRGGKGRERGGRERDGERKRRAGQRGKEREGEMSGTVETDRARKRLLCQGGPGLHANKQGLQE